MTEFELDAITLRRAEDRDCRLLWEWANDPDVRSAAFSQKPIPWPNHEQWFARKLADPHCHIFLACDRLNNPIGQVRFDVNDDDEAEIDIGICRSCRGRGVSSVILAAAVEKLFSTTRVRVVTATVKASNERSNRLFRRTGFQSCGESAINGCAVFRYRLVRPEPRQ